MIARVESGASRREAADQYEISPSAAIKWVACYRATGSCAAKPRGGSTSPLEAHADFLLALIAEQPDLTLDEMVHAMRKQRIGGSRFDVNADESRKGNKTESIAGIFVALDDGRLFLEVPIILSICSSPR